MKRTSSVILGIVLLVLLSAGIYFYYWSESFNIFQSPDRKFDESQTTVLFVGDIMLDRGVSNAINREGVNYPFEGVRDIFLNNDLVVGNLEGTFTNEPSVSADGTKLQFTFNPDLALMLKEFGFSGFSLANNHAFDFGRQGFKSTKDTLIENDMFYFGSQVNEDLELSVKVGVKGKEVCFIGYHQLFNSSISPIVNELNDLVDECEYIVVSAHWGNEYEDEENEEQRKIGRAFIDAGADLVIGHHPHVVQPVEIYKNKAIFYSLGNFLFDQDFSLATRQSLAVRLVFTDNEQHFELIPIEMSRARLYYPEEESFASRMNILTSKLPEELYKTAISAHKFALPR